MGYVYPSSVCVPKECTGMQPLGRHFVTRLKGGSTLGPALVLLDVVAERHVCSGSPVLILEGS